MIFKVVVIIILKLRRVLEIVEMKIIIIEKEVIIELIID